jgi:hypothetical protein
MIELTPNLEQAMAFVCDLALKAGGMSAIDAVMLIRQAATAAKAEEQLPIKAEQSAANGASAPH